MVSWGVILRNVFSNWTGYVLTSALSFLLAPFLVHALGKTGYGLWALVLSFTGYFGLLDLGIRSSVGRFVARYMALQDVANVNRTISTAFTMLACGGVAAMLTTVVVAKFFFGRFQAGPELEVSGRAALLLVGLNVSLVLPMGIFSSVLIALERFDILNTITVLSELLRAALIVIVIKLGYGLAAISGVAVFISVVQYGAIFLYVRSFYPHMQVSYRLVSQEALKELSSYGIFRFITIVSTQLIFYSQSLVIGVFLGVGAITFYAIAASLLNTGRSFVMLVTDTLTPAASRMDATSDIQGLHRLLFIGTRMALIVALPICLGFIFLGRQFMALWMGKEFVTSGVLLAVLTIPQFSSMAQHVSTSVLSAMAKHRVLAYLAVAEGVVNVAISILLVRKMGVMGVAIGTVVPHLISTALIMPLYTLRVLNLGVREYLVKAVLRPVLCALPVAGIAYAFSTLVESPGWFGFWAEVSVLCAVFFTLSFFFCLGSEQRDFVQQKARKVWNWRAVAHEA
jgi:O-antigen/teichoic acid export membrane protein